MMKYSLELVRYDENGQVASRTYNATDGDDIGNIIIETIGKNAFRSEYHLAFAIFYSDLKPMQGEPLSQLQDACIKYLDFWTEHDMELAAKIA